LPTTNVRKTIKVSKEVDFGLVFFLTRNKELSLGVGAQGGIKNPKPTTIMTSPTKINPKLSNFF